MSDSRHDFSEEKKDEALGETPPNDKSGFLSSSSPLIKVRKRNGSLSSSASGREKESLTLPRDVPVLKKGRKERDEEALISPKRGSPRKEGSPRWDSKNSSPRLHALWNFGSNRSSPRSASNSPRLEYNPLPITEDEINECISRADAFIAGQAKIVLGQKKITIEDIYFHPDALGAGGVYMDAGDSENKFVMVITRTAAKSGWKYYLIEKIYLLVDEHKKVGPKESDILDKSSLVGRGNEGTVVFAWDLQPSSINGVVIREKVVAKIHHLKSSTQATLNEQIILGRLGLLYGRFDYSYDESGTKIEMINVETVKKVIKKVIVMKLFTGEDLMAKLYKLDLEKKEEDRARYSEKINHSPLYKVRMGLGYIKAAHILQEKGVTHRDLKPNNALIDENCTVYFIDYSSAVVTQEMTGKESYAGTFPFSAPEMDKLKNKNVRNVKVSDNYSVGISLIEILTTKNFRAKVIDLDVPDRISLQLTREEFVNIAPDLFYADVIVNFEERLQAFIKGDLKEYEKNTRDGILQDLIYQSYGRSKLIKIILSLARTNPNERMTLADAEEEWGAVEQELVKTYQAFNDILKAKAYLQHKQLPFDIINKATDKMSGMDRVESDDSSSPDSSPPGTPIQPTNSTRF